MPTIDTEAAWAIKMTNVSKSFGKKVVLDDITFEVKKEETLAVIGASGTGKSTILKLVSGLLEPDSGDVVLNSANKSMAFQFGALLNFLTVGENIALPLKKKSKLSKNEIEERVDEVLQNVGLLDAKDLYPLELSGGMQKRAGFARAVVSDPDIILYDEPTSGLDPMTSNMILTDICHLKEKVSASGIVVTHNMDVVEKVADKVMLLYNGKIVFLGKSDELTTSDNPYAQQFSRGKCNGPMHICNYND